MSSRLPILHKLLLLLLVVVLLPLIASTLFSIAQARSILLGKVAESRRFALDIGADRFEALTNRMVSAAFFSIRSNQLEALLVELDDFLERGGPFSPKQNLRRREVINEIHAFLENLSHNLIGVHSYVGIVTEGGNFMTTYSVSSEETETYLYQSQSAVTHTESAPVAWKGIEKNYVSYDAPTEPLVLSLVIDLSGLQAAGPEHCMVISIPQSVLGQTVSQVGAPGMSAIVDTRNATGINAGTLSSEEFASLIATLGTQDAATSVQLRDSSYYIQSASLIGDRLRVLYGFDEATVTKEFNLLRWSQVSVAAIVTVLALTVGFGFSQNLVRPLQRLTEYASEFELDTPPVPREKERRDEIGRLEEAFSTLHERISTLLEERSEQEKRKRRAELEALQAQIQPHFLFNTLNTIRWAAVNGNTEKVSSTIIALASLLEKTITTEDALVTLEQEFGLLRQYAAIMQRRRGHELEMTFSLDPAISSHRVPKLILQPLLENAIIHGFGGEARDGFITVMARQQGTRIRIETIDNGKGMANPTTPETSSQSFSRVGLRNVSERLKLHYGEGARFWIESEVNRGTTAVVEISGDLLNA